MSEYGEMTVTEAASLGGAKRKESCSSEEYAEMGRKGGLVNLQRHGREYFARIGKLGGQSLAESRGKEYFREISRKAAKARKEAKGMALLLLLLPTAARAQSVTIPIGNVTVTPNPPSFQQPASVTINQSVTVSGQAYMVSGTLSGTLTFTPSGSTTGSTTGATTGTTTGATTGTTTTGTTTGATTTGGTLPPAIQGIYDLSGNHVASAGSGATVNIRGQGFGTVTGTVTAAGLSATPTFWLDTSITTVLPTVSANTSGPIVVTPPGGAAISLPGFTLIGAPAVVPTGPLGNVGMGLASFSNAAGIWTHAFAPGDVVNLLGWGFGSAAGTVGVDQTLVPINSWSDRAIRITLPLTLNESDRGCAIDIQRPDGAAFSTSMGFVILPRPAPPSRPRARRR